MRSIYELIFCHNVCTYNNRYENWCHYNNCDISEVEECEYYRKKNETANPY